MTLQTLKSKPIEEQVRTIEKLTDHYLSLYERIRPLLEDRSEDSVFHISVSSDRRKVVRIVLLAVVAADITTIPDRRARAPYGRRLDKLCEHFSVDVRDVNEMTRHVSWIEDLLVG